MDVRKQWREGRIALWLARRGQVGTKGLVGKRLREREGVTSVVGVKWTLLVYSREEVKFRKVTQERERRLLSKQHPQTRSVRERMGSEAKTANADLGSGCSPPAFMFLLRLGREQGAVPGVGV